MKIIGIFLLAILTIALCACNWFNGGGDTPTTPNETDYRYQAELVSQGVLGWTVTVEYPGMPIGYLGNYVVGTQDHLADWKSEYDVQYKTTSGGKVNVTTRSTVYDSTQKPIMVFVVDKDKAVRDDSIWQGPGWQHRNGEYFVQLDCR